MTHPLIDRLSARTLLADGAMGTLIHEAGVPMGTCFDHLNLSNPDLIGSIHRAYVSAGADIIETNTYGANQLKLAEFGLEDKVRDINLRAVKIAREAREVVGREVFVVGSIGPTRSAMDPLMPDEIKLLEPIYAEQIEALLEGGVDAICIETISDIREMAVAVNAVRKTSDLPIIASLAFGEDGTTPGGNPVNEVVASLLALDVDVVGANCSVGPNQMLPIIQMMTSLVSGTYNRQIPVSTMPNAGWPARVDGRYVFSSSPDYLGKFAAEAAVAGARLIGGCCGTTPDHTHAMRRTLDEQEGHSTLVIHEVRLPSTYEYEENGDESPTELKRKLGKDFVICVEIDPPKGLESDQGARWCPAPEGCRRYRDQRSRLADGAGADERADDVAPHPGRSRSRGDRPFHDPGSQPDGNPERVTRRACGRSSQYPGPYRRSAEPGRLPGFVCRLRHRFDRPDQSPQQDE